MEGQPMLQSTASSADNTIEEVSVGCVMHRYKGYKAKRRWGQLRVEVKGKMSRCIIRLHKQDVLNIHQEVNKAKEPKLKYEMEFTNEDFCGLERGEHFDKHGQRRYLCIITKDKHLIIEDAVVTATGINHNVLGTWTQLLSQVMHYVNRWKLIENNPKLAVKVCYLHVSLENITECHSLEDKTRESRNCLVLRMWKTRALTDIKERVSVNDQNTYTDLTFNVVDNTGGMDTVNMTVEGTPNLRQIINQLKRANGEIKKATTTVCPAFDDLNFQPNLVPKQNAGKRLKKFLPRSSSSNIPKDDSNDPQKKTNRRQSQCNHYVKIPSEEQMLPPPSYYNVNLPPEEKNSPVEFKASTSTRTDMNDPNSSRGAPGFHDPRIKVPPSLLNQGADHPVLVTRAGEPLQKSIGSGSGAIKQSSTSFGSGAPRNSNHIYPLPRPSLPSNGRLPSASPPRLPSPEFGDDDFKKAPGLATQTSYDSDYATGDPSLLTDTSLTQNRYVNLQLANEEPEFPLNETSSRNHFSMNNMVYQNISQEQPPAVPARDVQVVPPSPQPYINIENRNSAPNLPTRVTNAPPIPPKISPSTPANSFPVKVQYTPENNAPPLPERPETTEEEPSRPRVDLLVEAILGRTLPPIQSPEEQPPAYENTREFELSIHDVLQGTHLNVGGRWLEIPHSLFIKIALGLEKEGITVGDWKALAEKLGLTLYNIQHLASLMRTHSTLRPLEVLLLHWSLTQYPLPCSRANLKELLIEIGRDDLAQLIPSQPNP